MMRNGNGWGDGFGAGSPHFIGAIAMIALWVALIVGIIVLVIWLVRSMQHGTVHAGGVGAVGTVVGAVEPPLDILKKRYARGEIDKAEFEEKKKDLST